MIPLVAGAMFGRLGAGSISVETYKESNVTTVLLAVVSVLTLALLAVSLLALSLRRKLRSMNPFGERAALRSAHRDMLEILVEAAVLGSFWETIEKIVALDEQIYRISRLGQLPAEHLVRELLQRVKTLLACETLPDGWSLALVRGLEGQLNQSAPDWTLKALSAWRDELYSQLREAISVKRRRAESAVG